MSALSLAEMNVVLDRIQVVDRDFKQLAGFPDTLSKANPPASDPDVGALQAVVRFPLPSSYTNLLRIANGIKNFKWVRDDLLSTHDRVARPNLDELVDRKDMWFFILGDDIGDGTAFDLKTQAGDGEMEVVEFAGYVEDVRWPSLSDFLVGYRQRLEEWLDKAHADRAKTDDD